MTNFDIPELINNAYNRQDGSEIYEEAVKHFLQYFENENEARHFCNELLKMCAPAAAVTSITLSSLLSMASAIVGTTKRYDVFAQFEVIFFLRRLLIMKAISKYE